MQFLTERDNVKAVSFSFFLNNIAPVGQARAQVPQAVQASVFDKVAKPSSPKLKLSVEPGTGK
jgi:hypothetical protein